MNVRTTIVKSLAGAAVAASAMFGAVAPGELLPPAGGGGLVATEPPSAIGPAVGSPVATPTAFWTALCELFGGDCS